MAAKREEWLKAWDRADSRVVQTMAAWSIPLLRFSLAVVFIWFGALKLAGRSPVADLVAQTIYWLPGDVVVPLLGAFEVAVGLGLLMGVAMRLVLLLFWLQMAGTFLVLVIRPHVAFQNGNPLLLTTEGEFVIKNLVLIAAGLAIGSTLRSRGRWRGRQPPPEDGRGPEGSVHPPPSEAG